MRVVHIMVDSILQKLSVATANLRGIERGIFSKALSDML